MFLNRAAMQIPTLARQALLRNCYTVGHFRIVNNEQASHKCNVRREFRTSSRMSESFKVQDPKDFEQRVVSSDVPVIVDFFATWCNPCRTLGPRLESVIAEQNGKVKLAKVDIDENTDLALEYEVASVPVLLAIKNGKEEMRLVGLQDTDKLKAFVDQVLKK